MFPHQEIYLSSVWCSHFAALVVSLIFWQFVHFHYSILDTTDHIGEETMESCGRCIWTPLADCLGSNPDTTGVSIQCQLFCSVTTEDPYFGKLGLYINIGMPL